MDSKPFYTSKSVWGAVVAILAVALQMAGHAIAPDDQLALVNLLSQGGELVGIGVALWGRLVARHTLT